MRHPLPTPYDITEIPNVPWDPGTHEWFLLLVITLVAVALVWLWHLVRRGRKLNRVVEQLLKEIERGSLHASTASAERISRAARRVVEHTTRHDLGGLSPDELSDYAASCSTDEERNALGLIAELESRLYAPPSEHKDEQTAEIARSLLPALRALTNQRRRA
jgi:hypothetical protein